MTNKQLILILTSIILSVTAWLIINSIIVEVSFFQYLFIEFLLLLFRGIFKFVNHSLPVQAD
jgi:uncharacterized membrane protein